MITAWKQNPSEGLSASQCKLLFKYNSRQKTVACQLIKESKGTLSEEQAHQIVARSFIEAAKKYGDSVEPFEKFAENIAFSNYSKSKKTDQRVPVSQTVLSLRHRQLLATHHHIQQTLSLKLFYRAKGFLSKDQAHDIVSSGFIKAAIAYDETKKSFDEYATMVSYSKYKDAMKARYRELSAHREIQDHFEHLTCDPAKTIQENFSHQFSDSIIKSFLGIAGEYSLNITRPHPVWRLNIAKRLDVLLPEMGAALSRKHEQIIRLYYLETDPAIRTWETVAEAVDVCRSTAITYRDECLAWLKEAWKINKK